MRVGKGILFSPVMKVAMSILCQSTVVRKCIASSGAPTAAPEDLLAIWNLLFDFAGLVLLYILVCPPFRAWSIGLACGPLGPHVGARWALLIAWASLQTYCQLPSFSGLAHFAF